MSFQSALVDRARRVHRLVGHRNPELGESEQVVQYGEWGKCRLNPPDANEGRAATEAIKSRITAEILLPKNFELDLNDRLEIQSKELGTSIWIVQDQPKFLRRKRSVIGKTATVLQIVDM
jgi:hypothetical protein